MRNFSFIERLIAVCCILAIMLSFPWTPVSAAAETDVRVTASTNASVKQGNSAYGYVYIDSMESLSTLEVTVHFDPAVVQVTGSYNQVDALVYDSGSTESTLQYTYIFDGNGQNAKTQLFYFEYIVKKDAPVGQSYFDIVVGDAFDASFNTLPVSGSRCSFQVAQTVTNLSCSIRGTSSVSTAVNGEFSLTYSFSTTAIASGAAVIRYDPELFAVTEVTQGTFLKNKMTDINTSLSGAVYLSFLGTEYASSSQILTLRFKTLKNVTQTSSITMQVSDLYDLQLNPITCNGYTTSAKITYDPTVDENAPYVFLEQDYDAQNQTLTVRVCLEEKAHLGAGDFVLQFDTQRLAYKSAVKGYNPTFFNINNKNIDEGLLKFSVISLTDMTVAVTMLTATFDVITPCENTETQLVISGSGLANYLTEPIVLNFTGCTVKTAGHTAVVDAAAAPDCLNTGLTEGSHCAVCQEVLVAQKVVAPLGHDEIPHEAAAPTCTEIGWEAYNTCSRCDYTTYQEIPANGHTFQKGVCVICGADQDPGVIWDVSTAADGSLMAKLYLNADGTYDLQLTGSGPMKSWGGSSSRPWYSYREKITGIRLPDGLTTIGDYAFYGFTALTAITLPESLESLGYMAFYQCTKLQQINFNAVAMNDMTEGNHVFSYCGQETDGITLRIGADVEKIPAYLFLPDTRSSYKPKLTAVEFEAGGNCLEIGRMAFYQCRDISQLQLPEGLQSIDYYAFGYCSGLESLTLPEGLMTIENYAFYACDALQEVELPGSLQSIGAAVFYSCDALRKVTVNEGVTAIAERAFYGCTSLSSLQLPESLQTLGSSAFQGCYRLSELQLQKGLVTIGEYAFYGCTGLTELTLPEGLQTIGSSAFQGCTGITELTLPESLQNIGSSAFYNCTALEKIQYNAIHLADLSSDNGVFSYCGQSGNGITVTVGSKVEKIPDYLFRPSWNNYLCPNIQTVNFEENSSCESIGSYTFYSCEGITELTLPESLQTIGSSAFDGCNRLDRVYMLSSRVAQSLTSSGDAGALTNYARTIVLPGEVQLSNYLQNRYAVRDQILRDGESYWLLTQNAHSWQETEVLIQMQPCQLDGLIRYLCQDCGVYQDVTVDQHIRVNHDALAPTCTEIGWYAYDTCARCDYTTYVEIPADGVTHDPVKHEAKAPTCTEIGWKAYETCSRCDYTTYVEIPADGVTHDTVKHDALAPTCLEIGWDAYETCSRCDYSTYAEIPALGHDLQHHAAQAVTCTAIGWGAYDTCSRCDYSTYVEIPALGHDPIEHEAKAPTCTDIGWHAYDTCSRCDYTTRVDIPANGHSFVRTFCTVCGAKQTPLYTWDVSAAGDGSLMAYLYTDYVDGGYELELAGSGNPKDYSYNAPWYNYGYSKSIRWITLPEGLTAIGNHFFNNCAGVTELTLPESLQRIGSYAFYNCTGITELTLPESLQTIGNYAFYECRSLTQINFNAINLADLSSSNRIFAYAGQSGDGVTVSVGSGVTKIPACLFYPHSSSSYAPKIKAVEFAEGSACQSIGGYAFYNCAGITELTLPESLQNIVSRAFFGCTGLRKAVVMSSAVAEQMTSADAAGYLTQYAQTVLLPGDTTINSYLQNKYANREQILRDGVSYWLLDQNEHSWQETQTLIQRVPCQVDGLIRYTCEHCNVYKDVIVERHTIVGHEAKAPDCETVGWDAYQTCAECEYTTYAEIPALGHWVWQKDTSGAVLYVGQNDASYPFTSDGDVFASTNKTDGSTSSYVITAEKDCTVTVFCKVSSETNYDKLILQHNGAEIAQLSGQLDWREYSLKLETGDTVRISYQKDGSVSSGQDTGWFRLKAEKKILVPAEEAEPTCLDAVVCSVCKKEIKAALGHDEISHAAQTVTCLEIGWDAYVTCSRCEYTTYKEIPALGHDRIKHEAQAVTCLEIGWDAYETCSRCDYSTYAEIPALGHDLQNHAAKAVTCLAIGWDAYDTCSRCDYSTYVEVPALGHDPIGHEAKAPTCTEIGWDTYETCSRCDYTTYVEIPANGHRFVETFCTVCGTKQTPDQSWDVSAAGDGSLMAHLYKNFVDGGYELEFVGSGAMVDYGYSGGPWDYCRLAINRVSLPEGLTYIGARAFQYFESLRQIRIPVSVERIDNNAFNYAKNLVVIFEGDNASLAPSYGWYGCGYYFDPQKVILDADATYVIDKDGNAVLAKYIGAGSEFVTREEVDGIPVTQIGRYAFYQKKNLKTYWIPTGIQHISENAFSDCGGLALLLENTELPASLGYGWNDYCNYYLGAKLFAEEDFLFVKDMEGRVDMISYLGDREETIVPARIDGCLLTRIRDYAFYGSNVKRVILPEGIVSIGARAFENSTLEEIQLPQSLVEIKTEAFRYATKLQTIRLPEGLQRIENGVFWGCYDLKEVRIPDSITSLSSTTFTDCHNLEKVTLPKNLTSMGYMQFYGCPNLKEVELPEGVHTIESNSFYNCRSLKVVYVRSAQLAAQLTGSGNAHEMIQNAVVVVVPAGSGTDYLKATYPYCETRERKGMAVDVYSKCSHRWTSETVTEYVHCESDEYVVHTCDLCGTQTDTRIPMHTYGETQVAPTCTEDGYTLHACPDCGDSYRTDPVAKLGHVADPDTFLCSRCGQEVYLLLLTYGAETRGYHSWDQAMMNALYGSEIQLRQDFHGDVTVNATVYLDLNGHSIHGTVTVNPGFALYGMDSANDDFDAYGRIESVVGDGQFVRDVTLSDGRRYVALTDDTGVSFHRLQLQLHTVSLRTAKAGLYYKASLECDEALRNAISYHGVALSLERMPGADFKADGHYTWIKGAPTGDFTSGSVFNIFRSDLSAAENAARGAMEIYANAYLQLADGTVLMSDLTTGDQTTAWNFDGVAYSLFDVLQLLDTRYPQLTAQEQQSISEFYTAWKKKGMQDLQLENIGTEG